MTRTFRLFAVLAGAALTASAGEGRIPIWAPVVIGPGAEGKYIVTRDVVGLPGSPVILILPGTMAVDIDLNGFSLRANAADAINARGVDSLTIRNGGLVGAINGVYAESCRKVVVEDVKIQVVQMDGIALSEVDSFALRRNIVLNATNTGIYIDGALADPSTTTTGAVDENVLESCGRGVALDNGSSVGIKNKRIETTTVAEACSSRRDPTTGSSAAGAAWSRTTRSRRRSPTACG